MTSRNQRAQIARETVEILQRESYSKGDATVSLAAPLAEMRSGTELYTPGQLESLLADLQPPQQRHTQISVVNCTTFAAARSLIEDGCLNPLCLNFASAKKPGGGFLSGAQAQEECLARASGLHASLTREMDYYEANRSHRSSLYTNHLIYSPGVPVFRSDDDTLLTEPYLVSIVTSPAVNAGAVRRNEPSSVPFIRREMETRIRSVLAVARHHHHDTLVLGAWGCGVFRNDSSDVARWFSDALRTDPQFQGAFERVVFAVLDFAASMPTFNAFASVFAGRSGA